ncbi:MAG: hypothetical protein NC118_03605 [Eubacterium sp.]|nr:hypothetical protein [Eubacterium sp.]
MKKIFIIILLIYVLYVIEGCGQRSDEDTNDAMTDIEEVVEKNAEMVEEENIGIIAVGGKENSVKNRLQIEETVNDIEERESNDTMVGQNEEYEVIENPYFPVKEYTSFKIHAEYYNQGFVDEIADAEINRIKIYKEGCIYKLTMYVVPEMSSWYFKSGENMSMYLYVTADKIYWLLPYAQPESGGKSINFYDDDALLVKTLDTDEKLQNIGVFELVCQGEEIHEEYFSMTQEEDRITYYYSEIKESGEPGGESLFVWEKGKGLVEFGIGYGPGPMDVHIDEICEVMEDE